jgi:hypothetical protein
MVTHDPNGGNLVTKMMGDITGGTNTINFNFNSQALEPTPASAGTGFTARQAKDMMQEVVEKTLDKKLDEKLPTVTEAVNQTTIQQHENTNQQRRQELGQVEYRLSTVKKQGPPPSAKKAQFKGARSGLFGSMETSFAAEAATSAAVCLIVLVYSFGDHSLPFEF